MSLTREYGWDGFEKLDEGLTIAGCKHPFRTIEVKKSKGIQIFGLQLVEPKSTFTTFCKLKGGLCGFPCPKGINRKKNNDIHREASKSGQ